MMKRPIEDKTPYKTLWGELKEQCGRFGLTDVGHDLTSLRDIMDKIEAIHNSKPKKRKNNDPKNHT